MAIAKQILDYPDYYISSAGNIWREKSNDFFLKLRPSKEGLVQLCTNGECKCMRVHRIVAMTFVPVPEQYQGIPIEELDVHHINFNHNDNRASNLMWLTKTEHRKLHSESEVTFKRKSEALKGRQKPEGSGRPPKAVIQYTKEGDFVTKYVSIPEAERLTNIAHQNICSCCNGKRNYAGGYKWRYAD